MISWITDLDINILYYVQENLRGEFLNKIVPVFTSLGNYGLIWILLIVLLLMRKDTRQVGIMCTVALIFDVILCNGILKNVVARRRPYETYKDIRCLLPPQIDYSFPSGHTASSFAVAIPVIYHKHTRKLGVVTFTVAVLMALSRLYVCVHYPSDIICGVIVGVLCGILSCFVCYKYIVTVQP